MGPETPLLTEEAPMLRRDVFTMIHQCGDGHSGAALPIADLTVYQVKVVDRRAVGEAEGLGHGIAKSPPGHNDDGGLFQDAPGDIVSLAGPVRN